MVDLCKLDFKYPVILAEAVDGLYDLLPTMDNEVVERFASFLADRRPPCTNEFFINRVRVAFFMFLIFFRFFRKIRSL